MNIDIVDHNIKGDATVLHKSIDEHGSKSLAGLHTLALLTSLLRIKPLSISFKPSSF